MKKEIQAWLKSENRDFNKGLDLFQQANKNRSIYLYLARKQDMDKLVYELEKLARFLPAEKEEVKEPVTDVTPEKEVKTVQLTSADERINREDLSEDLKKVYDELTEKHKHQRAYHERMKLEEADDAIRAEARAMVVKLDDELVGGWADLKAKHDAEVEAAKAKEGEKQNEKTVVTPAPEVPAEKKEATPAPAKDPLSITKEVNAARKFISTNLDKVATSEGTVKEVLVTKLKQRYTTLVSLKAEVDPETIDKLIKAGIIDKT